MSSLDAEILDGLARALRAARGGDVAPLEQAVTSPRLTGERSRIWRQVAGAALHTLERGPDPGVRPGELAPSGALDPIARLGAQALSVIGVRRAVLALDHDALEAWIDAQARHAGDEIAQAELACSRAWLALLEGHPPPASHFDTIAAIGRRAGAPVLPIEASVLSSLAAEGRGDLAGALDHARRASRMARTEALPQEEYLANWALARMRRVTGHPHLAARILLALLRVAGSSWRPLLAWELLLSRGSIEGIALSSHTPAGLALGQLDELLGAARRGERAAFDGARDALSQASGIHRDDAYSLPLLLDPEAPVPRGDHAALRWKRGELDPPPGGLAGSCVTAARTGATAFVVCDPDGARQRVLSDGLGLLSHASTLPKNPHAQVRTDTTIAVLALAGAPGMDQDALFERVYGFPYGGERHRGVRDVLFHRVRSRLGSFGILTRIEGTISLAHEGVLATPDPRCEPPPEQSLLHELAKVGHLTAPEAAQRLATNLRTVQRALKRLADEGVCEAVKRGGNIEFYLDDTTFREPTGVAPPRTGA